MPYLVFDGDDTNTTHVVRNLDTAPPRAVIALQEETKWELKSIRDAVSKADFYGALIMAYLTTHSAGRPVAWDYLMDTPMSEWPWEMKQSQAEIDAAAEGADAVVPPQSRPDSDPGGEPQAEA